MAPSPGFHHSTMSVRELGSLRQATASLEAQCHCSPEPADPHERAGLSVVELRTTVVVDAVGECLLRKNPLRHPWLGDSSQNSSSLGLQANCRALHCFSSVAIVQPGWTEEKPEGKQRDGGEGKDLRVVKVLQDLALRGRQEGPHGSHGCWSR